MEKLQQFIKEQGVRQHFAKGMSIFTFGGDVSKIYFLESGWIKISQEAEDGQMITFSLRQKGDLFGLAEVLGQIKTRARYAYSLTEVEVYALSTERLYSLLNEDPGLWQTLSKLMAERLIETQNYVRALTSKCVPDRLSWLLKRLITEKEGRLVIEIPLTHEELSFMASCSRQKVTQYLNLWKKQQYITYERGWIEILDYDGLFGQ